MLVACGKNDARSYESSANLEEKMGCHGSVVVDSGDGRSPGGSIAIV
jgi:hypothetical protein